MLNKEKVCKGKDTKNVEFKSRKKKTMKTLSKRNLWNSAKHQTAIPVSSDRNQICSYHSDRQ